MPGATIAEEMEQEELEQETRPTPTESERRSPGWLEWLRSEPGPGDVESYRQHPLNWDGSYEVGQVLRGLTGLLGNLRLAVVDILVGGLRLLSRRPPAPPAGGGAGPVAGA